MPDFTQQEILTLAHLSELSYYNQPEILDDPDYNSLSYGFRVQSTPNNITSPTFQSPVYDEVGNFQGYQTLQTTYDGFSGSAFYSASTNTYVISFRGTEGMWSNDNAQNLGPGGVVFDGANHPQLNSARQFLNSVMPTVPPGAKIILTGHSLGGYIATILSYDLPQARALVFNSPGVDVRALGGMNENVTYIYTAEWGLVPGSIHSVGDRVSGNVFAIENSSGHEITAIINALKGNGFIVTFYDLFASNQASSAISSARFLASELGITLGEALRYQLALVVESDPDLLNSPAFMRTISDQMRGTLDVVGLAQLMRDVIEMSGGTQCFPAGTLITMANSTQRRIEDIRLGDIVLSFDPATGVHLPRAVTKLYRGETDVGVSLTFTQNGVMKSLASTPERPFLTKGGQFAPISQVTLAGERWAA